MIDWFRQLGRASGNLGRVARRNPVWAVQSLIFSPFRFAGHLVRVVVLMLIVATVLILGSDALVWYLGLARYPLLHSAVLVLVWAAILVVPLRATQGTLKHYRRKVAANKRRLR